MNTSINFILQGKAGSKSFATSILSQILLMKKLENVVVADTDPVTQLQQK
ncbi:hypothetical protein [Escherichia coli]|nr:hypothetical protein [Escherichia coli]